MIGQATRPSLKGHYAGFISRALAFVIDCVVIGVTLVSVSWLVSVTVAMLKVIPGSDQYLDALFTPMVTSLLTGLFILGYHLVFIILVGQTPGKALMGLRVVRVNGGRLNAWHALVRVAGYLLSALPLGLGFIWIFIDDRRQAWHDRLAGTCVIYTWAARPDERFLADETHKLSTPEQPSTSHRVQE